MHGDFIGSGADTLHHKNRLVRRYGCFGVRCRISGKFPKRLFSGQLILFFN
jgi:hypothetical protein